MILDTTLDRRISNHLIAKTNESKKDHAYPGKLTGSMLGQPLQWQILKALQIPQKEFDSYTLRKFERGHHAEEWLLEQMPEVLEQQVDIEYKGAIGHIDAVIDTKDFDTSVGIIPLEVKSVSNAKFKRIMTAKQPDHSHLLQATFYALATKKDYFAIAYLSTDDYRLTFWIFQAKEYAKEVDQIIETFHTAMEKYNLTGEVPVFEPIEKWQANPTYCQYPDFAQLGQKECQEKVKAILG